MYHVQVTIPHSPTTLSLKHACSVMYVVRTTGSQFILHAIKMRLNTQKEEWM